VDFYAKPEDEIAAIRRAAHRSGCTVRTLRRAPGRLEIVGGLSRVAAVGPLATMGELVCRDGWGAARLLLSLAIEDSRTPGARALAARLRSSVASDDEYARAVHAFVGRIPFVREAGEIFQSGGFTIRRNAGDCDDHFRLAYALAAAGGIRAALGVLHHGSRVPAGKQGPSHAVALLWIDGGWRFSETTIKAALGEHPNDAALRLGLTSERTDIAKELVIMTEKDLPAVPVGFAGRNTSAQVALDAEALRRLGYLADDAPVCQMTDPTFAVFRRAVLAFQLATGLVPDGLVGPTTRGELARSLTSAGVEGFDYSTAATSSSPVPAIRLSADISDAFLLAVIAMADGFRARGARASAEDWLAVWSAESGIANIPNRAGEPYFGLNQMGLREQKRCGFSAGKDAWLALTLEEQLPFVACFYESAAKMGGGPSVFRDAGSLYVANIAPGLIGRARDPSAALYSYRPIEGMPSLHATDAEWATYNKTHSDPYAENRGLDRQKKGFISVDDMRVSVEWQARNSPRFAEVRSRVRALGAAPSTPSTPGLGGGAVASLLFVASGIGLSYAYSRGWL